jgi:hypothetical protein
MPPQRWASKIWRRLALAAAIALMAAVWLGVLPLVARHPAVDGYIRHNEELGIDPSAKFYTELPAMPDLLGRVERARARAEPAF